MTKRLHDQSDQSLLHQCPVIGIFQKIKLIGTGARGVVNQVKCVDTNTMYAMKTIIKDTDQKTIDKTLTEQKILMDMNHPFVCKLYYSFQTKLRLYIIMPYCSCGDFYGILQNRVCLTESQTIYYAACILIAIEYLHRNGVIHRDIKPENILIRETGHITLSDFDLSLYVPHKVVSRSFIKPFSLVKDTVTQPVISISGLYGTASYIAPEIIANKQYTCVIDWWSFGVLIYEMIFGTLPFIGKNDSDTFELISKCQLHIPSHTPLNVETSIEMRKLIRRLLRRNPKRRLGFQGGSREIADHPLFNDVNFQELAHQVPPIIPTVVNLDDLSCDVSEDKSDIINEPAEIWKDFVNINRIA